MKIGFYYEVFVKDEHINTSILTMELVDDDLKKVARAMEEINDGYPIELVDLAWLYESIAEDIWLKWDEVQELEIDDFDEVVVDIQKEMPQDLIDAVKPFLTHKGVNVDCYYLNGRNIMKEMTHILVRPVVFDAMVSTLIDKKIQVPDFSMFKVEYPDYYKEIWDALKYKRNVIGQSNIVPDLFLQDFPYQVYENI